MSIAIPYVCLSSDVCLFVAISVFLLSFCLSVFLCLSLCRYICMPIVILSVCLSSSVCLFVAIYVCLLSFCLSVFLCLSLSLYLYAYCHLSVCPFVCLCPLSVSLCFLTSVLTHPPPPNPYAQVISLVCRVNYDYFIFEDRMAELGCEVLSFDPR